MEGGKPSVVPNEVQVPVVSEEDCRLTYQSSPVKIDKSFICAGYPQGGKDACAVRV